ncbi:hypothetical protein PUNSTDRAFT_126632, partial [Punctularia strigosozonata HHB-11173 SS5]|uniref:uncharacterized protein n=1 Tax=Punctularia strigosozonata (strain HHB-11173) TaxID=741275 RepID=UPI00044178FD
MSLPKNNLDDVLKRRSATINSPAPTSHTSLTAPTKHKFKPARSLQEQQNLPARKAASTLATFATSGFNQRLASTKPTPAKETSTSRTGSEQGRYAPSTPGPSRSSVKRSSSDGSLPQDLSPSIKRQRKERESEKENISGDGEVTRAYDLSDFMHLSEDDPILIPAQVSRVRREEILNTPVGQPSSAESVALPIEELHRADTATLKGWLEFNKEELLKRQQDCIDQFRSSSKHTDLALLTGICNFIRKRIDDIDAVIQSRKNSMGISDSSAHSPASSITASDADGRTSPPGRSYDVPIVVDEADPSAKPGQRPLGKFPTFADLQRPQVERVENLGSDDELWATVDGNGDDGQPPQLHGSSSVTATARAESRVDTSAGSESVTGTSVLK